LHPEDVRCTSGVGGIHHQIRPDWLLRLASQMENELALMNSQRFQVQISGQWNDYSPKEDDALRAAFDQFVRKYVESSLIPESESRESASGASRYKEFVIKGRRYLVDFLEMKQVRKDNKKEYRVRPPAGSAIDESQDGPREQGHLKLTCVRCGKLYTLRHMLIGALGTLRHTLRADPVDWADCFYCHDCWRPFLEDKEEKKAEKNPKQRQVHSPSNQEPCLVMTKSLKKSLCCSLSLEQACCASCNMPFQPDEAIYLGAVAENEPGSVSCQPYHKHCKKAEDTANDEAQEAIEKVSSIAEYFQSRGLNVMKSESMLTRYIQEESRTPKCEWVRASIVYAGCS